MSCSRRTDASSCRQIVDRWGGGSAPFGAGWRKVMMWAFIVTDGLLFAGFLASYGYARLHDRALARAGRRSSASPTWPP